MFFVTQHDLIVGIAIFFRLLLLIKVS